MTSVLAWLGAYMFRSRQDLSDLAWRFQRVSPARHGASAFLPYYFAIQPSEEALNKICLVQKVVVL